MHFSNTIKARVIVGLLLSALSVPTFAQSANAQSFAADDAKRRVNIAGRQRMLSQRITKAACFIESGFEVLPHTEMLNGAYELFSISHDALHFGSETVGLVEEYNRRVLAALEDVDQTWQVFSPLVQDVQNGQFDNLSELDEASLKLLSAMDIAVGITAREYGEDFEDLPLILTITIDLAGRQRMFTQKMAKEFCLIDAGINVEENLAALADTRNYFNGTLQALIVGFDGMVLPAPNAQILAKLQEVQALWAGSDAILGRIIAGEPVSDSDRSVIFSEVEAVLVAMNQAVGMYETAEVNP